MFRKRIFNFGKILAKRWIPFSLLMLPVRKIMLCQEKPIENVQKKFQFDEYSIDYIRKNLNEPVNMIIIVQADFWPRKLANIATKNLKLLLKILDDDTKVVVLKTSDVKTFEKEFGVSIKFPSFLLVKNKYGPQFKKYASFKPEKILKFLCPFTEIKSKEDHSKLLSLRKNEIGAITYVPENSIEPQKIDKYLSKLGSSKSLSEIKNFFIFKITDKSLAESLNISDKPNDFFLIQKHSEIVLEEKSQLEINGKHFNVKDLKTNTKNPDEAFALKVKNGIFWSRIFEPGYGFRGQLQGSLVLFVDENKADPKVIRHWVSTMKKAKLLWIKDKNEVLRDTGIYYIKKSFKDGAAIRLIYRNDVKTNNEIMMHVSKSSDQVNKLREENSVSKGDIEEYPSHQYFFRNAPNVENIEEFIKEANNEKILSYHKTDKAKKYKKYSNKLVSNNFSKDILKSENSEGLFVYSNSCHFCMNNGGIYEALALQSLMNRTNSQLNYNRMNNDGNDIKEIKNFHYTPIFMLFRQGIKDRPYFYIRQTINFPGLKEFFEISNSYELMDEKKFYENKMNTIKLKNLNEIN